MKILQVNKRGIHIDKTEKFYICKKTIKVNQMKAKHTVTPIKYLKQYWKGKVIWLESLHFKIPIPYTAVGSYTQRMHTGRSADVKVILAFIKAYHNIKVLKYYIREYVS